VLARAPVALLGIGLLCACDRPSPPVVSTPAASTRGASSPAPGFLKGQLHAHTNRSGDSDTPPLGAVGWYAQHGFDFVVFTDHNRITEIDAPPGMLVFRGVEITENPRRCFPPPRPHEACLLHVNALFITTTDAPDPPAASRSRIDIYGHSVDRALALGGLAQVNHPNFQGGADVEVLVAMAKRGATLVEIANQAVDSGNEGDAERPSTEALWDAALLRGAHLFGTATDDAHHYDDAPRVRARGEIAYTGDRGFVMVRAAKTEPAIRAALVSGDFYASSGVLLDRLEIGPPGIVVEPRRDTLPPHKFEVIADGRVVQETTGPSLRFDPRSVSATFVRVRVTDGAGRHAWTQPLWR
jgi:hypothetical protein